MIVINKIIITIKNKISGTVSKPKNFFILSINFQKPPVAGGVGFGFGPPEQSIFPVN